MSWWDDLTSTVANIGGQIGNAAANVGDFAAHELNPFISAADRNAYENRALAPNADKIGQLLQPVNNFLTHDAIGQAIAPVLAGGIHTGSDGTGLGMGPQYAADIKNTMGPTKVGSVSEEEEKFANSSGFTNTPDMFGSQVNAAADAYKNQAGPPSVHMFNAGDIDPKSGLMYGGPNIGWGAPAQVKAAMASTSLPASTTPVSTSTVNASDLRVGDHRTTPEGVYQTWNGVGWNNGNSAAAPGDPAGSVPLNQVGQVSTTSQNPMTTPGQWDAAKAKWDLDRQAYISAGLDVADAERRATANNPLAAQPKPTSNPNNFAVPNGAPLASAVGVGQPGGPSGPPAPGSTGATGAAAGAADAGVLAALKGLGIDANTAAILASGLGSGLTTYLASKAQTDAAQAANTAQQNQFQKALDQQNAQFNTTNEINKGIYDTQQANLKPWLDAGTAALPKLQTQIDSYDPASFSTGSNWQDPGYHFRLDEGMKALQSSAAAKGGLLSGNTLRGITDYAQGAASQEYNNAFNRYQTTFGTKTNALQSLAGIGQTATTQTNAAGSSYGNAAQQAGQNNSNALSGILTGSGNAAANAGTAIGNANATGYVTGASILNNMMNQYFANQSANSQNALTAAMTGSK